LCIKERKSQSDLIPAYRPNTSPIFSKVRLPWDEGGEGFIFKHTTLFIYQLHIITDYESDAASASDQEERNVKLGSSKNIDSTNQNGRRSLNKQESLKEIQFETTKQLSPERSSSPNKLRRKVNRSKHISSDKNNHAMINSDDSFPDDRKKVNRAGKERKKVFSKVII
jgi:hypothetical protein